MWNWIDKLQELRNSGQCMIMVTVVEIEGSTPREAGAKMLVLSDGSFYGTIGGGGVEKIALDEARQCLEEGVSKKVEVALTTKNNMFCNGKMELYMELIYDNPQIYIFGAGHVGQALCRVLSGTPFIIHLVDERKEWIESDKIPDDVKRHNMSHETFINDAVWNNNKTYVAIMTYSAELDQDILEKVIRNQTSYIGLVGSSNKLRMVKANLAKDGILEDEFSKVKCPIGMKLGGKSPQELAISIAAEVLSVYHGKGNT